MAIMFVLDGDVDDLCIPAPGPPRSADRLWEQTCFEAFVGVMNSPTYYEFNFAPSGQWAAYAFQAYRKGQGIELEPSLSWRRTAERLELDAVIQLDRLPGILRGQPLRCGLSTVIEDRHGERSYWALRHPPGRPDFHHPDAFALELAPAAADFGHDSAPEGRQ
jgi:hypothetical protein